MGTNFSWVFARTLWNQVQDLDYIDEIAAHEVAHQWKVNNPPINTNQTWHCGDRSNQGSSRMYRSPGGWCTMRAETSDAKNKILAEFYDGIVGFHWIATPTGPHSEVLLIRTGEDPLSNQ